MTKRKSCKSLNPVNPDSDNGLEKAGGEDKNDKHGGSRKSVNK
jgi:hypothetical protein